MAFSKGLEPLLMEPKSIVLPITPRENVWCRWRDLNSQPTDYKSVALPIVLHRHMAPGAGHDPAASELTARRSAN